MNTLTKKDTVIELFEKAIKNDGIVVLSGRKASAYEDRLAAINFFSKRQLKASFLFSQITYNFSKNETLAKAAMDRIVVNYSEDEIYLNVYEALHLPSEEANVYSLKVFLEFFKLYKKFAQQDCEMIIHIAKGQRGKDVGCQVLFNPNHERKSPLSESEQVLIRDELINYILQNSTINDWLNRTNNLLTKHVGIWSWDIISAECVFDQRTFFNLEEKHYT